MAAAAAGMTYAEIARELQLAPTTFSSKLHGHRRWLSGEIAQLGQLLGVDAGWLVASDEDGAR